MSEYVVDFDNNHSNAMDIRERVTRCSDCVYKRKSWNGKRPAFSDWFFCAYDGGREITKPDGFCAWGERRDAE